MNSSGSRVWALAKDPLIFALAGTGSHDVIPSCGIEMQFYHTPESESILLGWHCVMVKGHADLKIEIPRVRETFTVNFSKLHNFIFDPPCTFATYAKPKTACHSASWPCRKLCSGP